MASMAVTLVIFMIVLRLITGEAIMTFCREPNIKPGFSLSPASNRSSLPSPSGYFEFGFYPERGSFAIGIWLVTSKVKTVVWTANRDDPPLTADARLEFGSGGELAVRGNGTARTLIAGVSVISAASLLDSGNLILCGEDSRVVWESFQHPTDTILQGQVLPVGGELLSSASDDDRSTGRFHLCMQSDGNLVLYPKDSENSPAEAYWSSETCCHVNSTLQLYLNATDGALSIVNATSLGVFAEIFRYPASSSALNGSVPTVFRATLGVDGNFRFYTHQMGDQRVVMEWAALKNPCDVKGLCGLNSYCTLYDMIPKCVCVPGTERSDDDDKEGGCLRNYTRGRCLSPGGVEDVALYSVAQIENMRWGDTGYGGTRSLSKEECGESCLADCDCDAAPFEVQDNPGLCKKHGLPLRFVMRDLNTANTAFFKIGNVSSNATLVAAGDNPPPRLLVDKNDKALTQILILALGSIALSCLALAVSGFYIIKIRVLRYKRLRNDGTFGMSGDDQGLALRVFSYNELKRATGNFKQQVGRGAFGTVYKGSLNKGRQLVAVKRLEKLVEEGEREFRAEMRAIGRTNHKNLVRLLGYCAEGSKRLLVYEYMSNGSLADLLFQDGQRLDWSERARIALEVARGILYLHDECKTPTIHCDIKPQNILMDETWTAKISDFGLAKFLQPDQTRTFTIMRGTRGYLAPEWHKSVPISVKADVYSFGVLLLEIVCCRRNMEVGAANPEELVLSTWAYSCFVAGEVGKLVAGEVFEKKALDNMVKVGLWCIQDQPALRPSMKSVVLMLQGITDVAIPPCPTSP